MNYTDLIGTRFDRLTVFSLDHVETCYIKGRSNGPVIYYRCLCDCNNFKLIRRGSLISGNTRSCGCLRREQLIRRNKSMSGVNSPNYGKQGYFRFGDKNPNWKGGVSSLRRRPRYKLKVWRKEVLERDNYVCRKCFMDEFVLNAHHIFSLTKYPKKRFEVSNGVTFCEPCHILFHKIFGIHTFHPLHTLFFLCNIGESMSKWGSLIYS